MLFSAYDYSITYQNSKDLVLPDYLSRHPAPVESNIVETIATFAEIAEVPVLSKDIKRVGQRSSFTTNSGVHSTRLASTRK
jgi:hypothetical protein